MLQDMGRRYISRVSAYSGAALFFVVSLAAYEFITVYVFAQSDRYDDPDMLHAARVNTVMYTTCFDIIAFSTIIACMISYGSHANGIHVGVRESLIKHRIHLRQKAKTGTTTDSMPWSMSEDPESTCCFE